MQWVRIVRLFIYIWLAAFSCLVVPIRLAREKQIDLRPTSVAKISNYRVIQRQEKNGYHYYGIANLDFQRPDKSGVAHCHSDNYELGEMGNEAVRNIVYG